MFFILKNNSFYILFLPPSQPSPKEEGAKHFPLGGNKKGGNLKRNSNMKICSNINSKIQFKNTKLRKKPTEEIRRLLIMLGNILIKTYLL
jgi:hypothetical protein